MIEGKGDITAEVVADSISNGVRLTTLSLSYPRFIHAEFMTHRMFSRNASSSRAIPIKKMNYSIANSYAKPIEWGRNQAGMQAHSVLSPADEALARSMWREACLSALRGSENLSTLEVHKQIANRITEPFQFIKVVVTATEWDNFFKLRCHPDAQPEIQELAVAIKLAMAMIEPVHITPDNPVPYHLPFISVCDYEHWAIDELSLDEMIKASVARCARVSYMNHDGSDPDIKKDIELHDRLLEAGHMSPFEHVAAPMTAVPGPVDAWDAGITHYDRQGNAWSGNFRGWIQYRNIL